MRRAHLGRICEVKRIRAPVVAPRSRAFGFCTSTGPIPVWIARTGSCPWRTTRRRPSERTSSAFEARNVSNSASTAWAISRRAPARKISVSGSSIAPSVEGKQLYSRPWRNAPFREFRVASAPTPLRRLLYVQSPRTARSSGPFSGRRKAYVELLRQRRDHSGGSGHRRSR